MEQKLHLSGPTLRSFADFYINDFSTVKGSFTNYDTRDAALFWQRSTPSLWSRRIFFRFGRATLDFCPLAQYCGPASRSILHFLGPRHARNYLGFADPSSRSELAERFFATPLPNEADPPLFRKCISIIQNVGDFCW